MFNSLLPSGNELQHFFFPPACCFLCYNIFNIQGTFISSTCSIECDSKQLLCHKVCNRDSTNNRMLCKTQIKPGRRPRQTSSAYGFMEHPWANTMRLSTLACKRPSSLSRLTLSITTPPPVFQWTQSFLFALLLETNPHHILHLVVGMSEHCDSSSRLRTWSSAQKARLVLELAFNWQISYSARYSSCFDFLTLPALSVSHLANPTPPPPQPPLADICYTCSVLLLSRMSALSFILLVIVAWLAALFWELHALPWACVEG